LRKLAVVNEAPITHEEQPALGRGMGYSACLHLLLVGVTLFGLPKLFIHWVEEDTPAVFAVDVLAYSPALRTTVPVGQGAIDTAVQPRNSIYGLGLRELRDPGKDELALSTTPERGDQKRAENRTAPSPVKRDTDQAGRTPAPSAAASQGVAEGAPVSVPIPPRPEAAAARAPSQGNAPVPTSATQDNKIAGVQTGSPTAQPSNAGQAPQARAMAEAASQAGASREDGSASSSSVGRQVRGRAAASFGSGSAATSPQNATPARASQTQAAAAPPATTIESSEAAKLGSWHAIEPGKLTLDQPAVFSSAAIQADPQMLASAEPRKSALFTDPMNSDATAPPAAGSADGQAMSGQPASAPPAAASRGDGAAASGSAWQQLRTRVAALFASGTDAAALSSQDVTPARASDTQALAIPPHVAAKTSSSTADDGTPGIATHAAQAPNSGRRMTSPAERTASEIIAELSAGNAQNAGRADAADTSPAKQSNGATASAALAAKEASLSDSRRPLRQPPESADSALSAQLPSAPPLVQLSDRTQAAPADARTASLERSTAPPTQARAPTGSLVQSTPASLPTPPAPVSADQKPTGAGSSAGKTPVVPASISPALPRVIALPAPGDPARPALDAMLKLDHQVAEAMVLPPPPDDELAKELQALRDELLASAKEGYARAQYALARLLLQGRGGSSDPAAAAEWLKHAAEKGNVEAQLLYGFLAAAGAGGTRKTDEAYLWWSVATAQGSEAASAALKLLEPAVDPVGLMRARASAKQWMAYSDELKEPAVPAAQKLDNTLKLVHAAARGDAQRVRTLLARGLDIGGTDQTGHTALVNAAWRGRDTTAALLVGAGADIDFRTLDGTTALTWAAANGYARIAKLLIESGATVDIVDNAGRTPLMRAAWNRHADVVAVLLAAGARPGAADKEGKTASDFARLGGDASVIGLLGKTR
jgi:TPR repeat protein